MLKARGTHRETGRPLVILGLTHDNIARMMANDPVLVDTTELGLKDGPWICIYAGAEDEAGLAVKLAGAGVRVPPEMTTYISKPGEERQWDLSRGDEG